MKLNSYLGGLALMFQFFLSASCQALDLYVATNGNDANPLIYQQDFESGTIPLNWANSSGTPNYNYQPALLGAYSLELPSGMGAYYHPIAGSPTDAYFSFCFKIASLPSQKSPVIVIEDDNYAEVSSLYLDSGGVFYLNDATETHTISPTATVATNVLYYCWIHIRAGTGTNQLCSFAFSAADFEPYSGTNFALLGNGTGTMGCYLMWFVNPHASREIFDHVGIARTDSMANEWGGTNVGQISQPFATLTAAINAARSLGTNTPRNIIFRGGEYFNVAAMLNANDSGLTIEGYPGEVATLYGGMLLTNWVSVSNGWYAASLPTYPASLVSNVSTLTDWQVRMLLVDGNMAVRAQYPTNSYSLFYTDTGGSKILHYSGNDLGSWLVLTNAEFQIDFSSDQQTTGASALDLSSNAITLYPAITRQPNLDWTGVNSYRVYNIAQGMSSPGQFFYDRGSRAIVYWPVGGKNPNTSECIIPTTTRVLYINGTSTARPWGITLSNLTIAASTVVMEDEGDSGHNWDPYSLIYALNCDNFVMDGLTLGRTAGNAIGMEYSFSTNTVLKNSKIYNCGGGGAAIRMGPCIISNNLIHSIGSICYQSPGVRVSNDALVTHNSIYDCKMNAVGDTYMLNCFITYNMISNCMQVLRDYGAIYTWSGTNNVIAHNVIKHVGGFANSGGSVLDWFRFGIYCDNYTYGYQIYNNVTFDVARPLQLNDCSMHTLTNNVFIDTSDIIKLQFMGLPTNNIVFKGNICYSSANIYIEATQNDIDVDNYNAVIDWRSNIFYSVLGGANGFGGIPTSGVTLNPQFASLSPLNLSFQPSSPAWGLGILPIYLAGVGALGLLPPTNLSISR